ncbi:HAMP domain-containing sensor histidine kinase [Prosthecobacter sp.]|uniref:HAMP domain-containing sensor histidine kinase n=1 Tax=Prosthecobacter sp. TaxID=1965333 RepID=UPI002AB87074|nr:HAMP domain-containing sensor histidine kinase [Prosthecobacter sp.]MDZ4404969.1 HAMP domain-containing sensor histidine kinase [Prosthecobacter sp.]
MNSAPTPDSAPPQEDTLKKLEEAGALSHFASSIAHEVCNPLSQIVLATDLLAGPRPMTDDLRKKIVSFLRQGADRIDKAMKSMLQTCSPIETSMTAEDANTLIESALASMTLDPSVRVEKRLVPGLPTILVDKKHITETIVGLCANAVDAMLPGGGTLTITTALKTFNTSEREGWQRQSWFRAGDHAVVIEIADTGHGIHKSQMPLIFEAFYTTKAAGKGAGLGLTVAKKVVDLHHGRLEISNQPAGGVLVVLTLKSAAQP